MGRPADNILVIKLGAMGDFIQALSPMQAIRQHHPDARITLLTTTPYEGLARASDYFNDIWLDQRPRWNAPGKWLALRSRLRGGQFKRVYDLQTSDRSSTYYKLFWPGQTPEWSGIVKGCSHPHANPRRDDMHTRPRQMEQLSMAGIAEVPLADLSWMTADVSRFDLPCGSERYALLVPGGAAHRPDKRWPVASYAELAGVLAARGIVPVCLGMADEKDLGDAVLAGAEDGINLAGQTSLLEIGALAGGAALAVGNDTGPMHLISAMGCRSVVLYSRASDPALCGQQGPQVEILRVTDLAALAVAEVVDKLALP